VLGSFEVTTDATGTAAFTRTITSPLPAADQVVTSTATNRTTGDTSELSAAVAIEAPGILGFSNATYTVNETDGTIAVTVSRTGGSEGTVTVQYATQPGSATAPSDFTATSGMLTFGPGVTTQSFTVPIVSDAVPEPEESFTIALSAPAGGATLGTATTSVIIASHLPEEAIPTASTWALISLAIGLAAVTLIRIGR
jgi:Calx-beta domain